LDEAAAAAFERLDAKAVFPVEDARREQAAKPAQLTVGFDGADCGLERRGAGLRRLDAYFELGARAKLAADSADERIPFRVAGEVADDRPYALGRRIDLDLSAELLDPSQSFTSATPDLRAGDETSASWPGCRRPEI
jgi:hypothetical protein